MTYCFVGAVHFSAAAVPLASALSVIRLSAVGLPVIGLLPAVGLPVVRLLPVIGLTVIRLSVIGLLAVVRLAVGRLSVIGLAVRRLPVEELLVLAVIRLAGAYDKSDDTQPEAPGKAVVQLVGITLAPNDHTAHNSHHDSCDDPDNARDYGYCC